MFCGFFVPFPEKRKESTLLFFFNYALLPLFVWSPPDPLAFLAGLWLTLL